MQRSLSSHFILLALSAFQIFILAKAFGPTTNNHIIMSSALHACQVDDQMAFTYESLASRLISRYNADCDKLMNNQLFVCIAGGPGSGKSTLASAVAELVNERLQVDKYKEDGAKAAVVLPMDGFHYTRSKLQSMGSDPDLPYTYEQLLARRGAEWTFDAEACVQQFTSARKEGEASLPVYSRVKSDPIDDGVMLHKSTKIVLLEGNYLLAWKNKRWAPLASIFDESWFIICKDLNEQRSRLIKRHLETWSDEKSKMWGVGEDGAGNKADSNDMLNAVWIDETSREFADLVIESL